MSTVLLRRIFGVLLVFSVSVDAASALVRSWPGAALQYDS